MSLSYISSNNHIDDKNVTDIGNDWKYNINQYNNTHNTNHQFRLIKNKARGNCLFIALEQAFPKYNRNNLRKQAIDYILNNELIRDSLLEQNINDYNNDLEYNTNLLNGMGWPPGGPKTIKINLSNPDINIQRKAKNQLKQILLKATYYADNEIIEALEDIFKITIILLSDDTGEISWHSISTDNDAYVIIYNYQDDHYELVEISENGGLDYKRNWANWNMLPKIIKDMIPVGLLNQTDFKFRNYV